MTQPSQSDQQTLFHEAMATTFTVQVVHPDSRYARHAVGAAFAELDLLESQLSRFVEGSDVWRINRLRRGETAVVSLPTFRCLEEALQLQRQTAGAFDITYASTSGSDPARRLGLTPIGCMVQKLAEGVQIDLGGIGKGFALDCMASVLHEWDILSARLSASTSTHLALDAPPNQRGWPVGFGPAPQLVALRREALAASGIGSRGQHIVDPRSHQPARHLRAWARAARGARADALSTAFLVMTHSERERYCRHWHVAGAIQDAPTRNHNPG